MQSIRSIAYCAWLHNTYIRRFSYGRRLLHNNHDIHTDHRNGHNVHDDNDDRAERRGDPCTQHCIKTNCNPNPDCPDDPIPDNCEVACIQECTTTPDHSFTPRQCGSSTTTTTIPQNPLIGKQYKEVEHGIKSGAAHSNYVFAGQSKFGSLGVNVETASHATLTVYRNNQPEVSQLTLGPVAATKAGVVKRADYSNANGNVQVRFLSKNRIQITGTDKTPTLPQSREPVAIKLELGDETSGQRVLCAVFPTGRLSRNGSTFVAKGSVVPSDCSDDSLLVTPVQVKP